jgi:hypothetical protein
MSNAFQFVLAAAMALPYAERELLAFQLLETVATPPGGDEDFFADLARRRQECLDGTDAGIPLAEVGAAIWKEFTVELSRLLTPADVPASGAED